ncbi:hypothetical protein LTR53_007388 [Teratosphaeriaceae sp. CCFEE 6253]|nr:hypothetical protein LTR53_007388 [Teratosphaeriaceae sp. CCFEE 6253]
MDQLDAPPIAALFHVVFDRKVGYTTAWTRSIPNLDVAGVEYKSLPSGLHGVESDLVYFVHGGHYAGVSAFAQRKASEAHRNAEFCAVGALVPLTHGRLGRGWLHAADLRELADGLLKHNDVHPLERFWEKHRLDKTAPRRPSSPDARRESIAASLKRKHGLSDATHGLMLDSGNAADHPALHMSAMLDLFGPLLFPLYRAGLLRKRILLLGAPPVQGNCSMVYVLSVLSSIPHTADEALQPDKNPLLHPQSLFSVGVAEIETLRAHDGRGGYIACTTDDILQEKSHLYDLLVQLPKAGIAAKKQWPRIQTSDGHPVKASQRDLRRYRMLRQEMMHLRLARQSDLSGGMSDEVEDETPMLGSRHILNATSDTEGVHDDENDVVEQVSWSAAAYKSVLWWASSGSAQNDPEAEEEVRFEREILGDLPDLVGALNNASPPSGSAEEALGYAEGTATALTAYFHRLTTHMITGLAAIVNEADDETEDGVEEDTLTVTADDVRGMGLDIWSANDRVFVGEMMELWFGRSAMVLEGGLKMCGKQVVGNEQVNANAYAVGDIGAVSGYAEEVWMAWSAGSPLAGKAGLSPADKVNRPSTIRSLGPRLDLFRTAVD